MSIIELGMSIMSIIELGMSIIEGFPGIKEIFLSIIL